jgi:hypothetical protein
MTNIAVPRAVASITGARPRTHQAPKPSAIMTPPRTTTIHGSGDSASPKKRSESTDANSRMERLELGGDRGHERDRRRDPFHPGRDRRELPADVRGVLTGGHVQMAGELGRGLTEEFVNQVAHRLEVGGEVV